MITYLVKIKWLLETQFLRFRGMRIGKYSYVANTLFIHGVNRVLIADKVQVFRGVIWPVLGTMALGMLLIFQRLTIVLKHHGIGRLKI